MYLRYREKYKKNGTLSNPIWLPVYNWYEITDHTVVNNQFSVGHCKRGVYVLYHTETLQAVCIGTKSDMRKLATKMKVYTFDGVNTWRNGSSTIRSLTKLQETKE